MMRRPPGRAAGLGALALILALPSQPIAAPRTRPLATPEAAVERFVNSVAADDFDGAMQAFAIDDRVAHFDFAKQARRLGSFIPTSLDAPSRYKMYVRSNTLRALKDAAN